MSGDGHPPGARPVRVLAVVHRSTVGGTEVCFERVLRALAADPGFEVVAAYPRDGDLVGRWDGIAEHVPYDAGVLPDTFDVRAYRGWLRRRGAATRAFQADVAAASPDVVVSFTSVLTAPVEVAHRLTVPAIAYVREFVQPAFVRRALWRLLARRSARLIAVSSQLARDLEPYAPGRVRLVRDGVPLPEVAHPADWPPVPPLAAFYGGYDERKGGEVFVRMARKVRERVPDARFAYHGRPAPGQEPFRDSMRRLAADLGLTADVIRFDEGGDFASSFGRSTVVVMASVREGLGLVGVDAMSHGVPVVASRTGGLPDVVEDGVTGSLVPVGDVDGFADAVSAIMADPAVASAMGGAARARVERLFAIDQAVDGLRAVIGEVVGGRR